MNRVSRRSLLRGVGLASLGVVATTRGSRTAMAVSDWQDTSLTYKSSDGSLPSLSLSANDLSFEFAYSNFPSGSTTVEVTLEARSPSHDYAPVLSGSFSVGGGSETVSIDGSTLNDEAFPVYLLNQSSISASDFRADTGKTTSTDVDFRVVFSAADTTTTVETTCTVEVTNTSSAIPDNGVSRYEFGDFTDSWGDNTGSNQGASLVNDAELGDAIELDSTNNEYVELPQIQMSGSGISLYVKIRPTYESTGSGYYRILSAGTYQPYNLVVFRHNSNEWEPYFDITTTNNRTTSNDPYSTIGPTTYSWDTVHDLVGVYDGSKVRMYVDGSEIASTEVTGNLDTARYGDAPNSYIGCRVGDDGIDEFANGYIGDARWYNTSLSSDEVSNLSSTGSING